MSAEVLLKTGEISQLQYFFKEPDGDVLMRKLLDNPSQLQSSLHLASERLRTVDPVLSHRLFAWAFLCQKNTVQAKHVFDRLGPANWRDVDRVALAKACRLAGEYEAAYEALGTRIPDDAELAPFWRREMAILHLLERDYDKAAAQLGAPNTGNVCNWLRSYLRSLAPGHVPDPPVPPRFAACLSGRLVGHAAAETKPLLIGILDYKTPDFLSSSKNIGDTMQSVAVLRHVARYFGGAGLSADDPDVLPAITRLRQSWDPQDLPEDTPPAHVVLVDRDFPERVEVTHPDQEIMLVLNGWFLHRVFGQIRALPLSKNIVPVILSFYLEYPDTLTPEVTEFLKRHEPIGCRDWPTTFWLLNRGIAAFFSGCVTTTLAWPGIADPEASPIYVDHPVPEQAETCAELLEAELPIHRTLPFSKNVDACLDLLTRYRAAPEVVTSRLHCYLPSRAIGANVTFVAKNPADRRFDGLIGLDDSAFQAMQDRVGGLIDLVYRTLNQGGDAATLRDAWQTATTPLVAEARAQLASAPSFLSPARVAQQSAPPDPEPDTPVEVALAFDAKIFPRVAPLLRALRANSQAEISIHALTRDVPQERFETLRNIVPDFTLRQIEMDQQLENVEVRLAGHITISTMDRLFLPELLPDMDRLVYIDIDTVVLGDIAELYAKPLATTGIAARATPHNFSLVAECVERIIRLHNYDFATARDIRQKLAAHGDILGHCINAGVLVMSLDRLRALDFTKTTLDLVERYGIEDQEAINLYLQGDFAEIGMEWNAQPYHDLFETAKLIHWVGGRKPWNCDRNIRKATLWRQFDT